MTKSRRTKKGRRRTKRGGLSATQACGENVTLLENGAACGLQEGKAPGSGEPGAGEIGQYTCNKFVYPSGNGFAYCRNPDRHEGPVQQRTQAIDGKIVDVYNCSATSAGLLGSGLGSSVKKCTTAAAGGKRTHKRRKARKARKSKKAKKVKKSRKHRKSKRKHR